MPRHRRSHLGDSRVSGRNHRDLPEQNGCFHTSCKVQMILNCQHLSPSLKNLKSYMCLSVIRSVVWQGGHNMESHVLPGFENWGRPPSLTVLALNLSFLKCKAKTSGLEGL